MKQFSTDDLLQYYYGESSQASSTAIRSGLESDWALRQKLKVIREAAEQLDQILVAPRTEAVQRILDHVNTNTSAFSDL